MIAFYGYDGFLYSIGYLAGWRWRFPWWPQVRRVEMTSVGSAQAETSRSLGPARSDPKPCESERMHQLYAWSAPDRKTLLTLPADPDGPCRLALVAANQEELDSKLALAARRLAESPAPRWRHRSGIFFADLNEQPGGEPVAFLFPGQGSEYAGMLGDARRELPTVAAWLDELDQAWGEPRPSRFFESDAGPAGVDLGGVLTTTTGLALAQALSELGVPVSAMAGPSSGENAALIAAGAMAFESRGQLFELLHSLFTHGNQAERQGRAPEADFLAVSMDDRGPLREVLERFPDQLWVALDNCPRQLVLAGTSQAILAAEARLAQSGAFSFRLPFRRAYHTPLYAPVARDLEREVYPRLPMATPQIPVYSCSRAEPYPEDPDAIRALAAEQWGTTVRFRETLLRMHQDGIRHFIEVGPGGRLAGFVRDTLRALPHSAWTTAAEGRSEIVQLLEVAAFLYCEGPARAVPPASHARGSLLSSCEPDADGLNACIELSPERHGFLLDHRLGQLPVVPFSFALELAAEAAVQLQGGVAVAVENARSLRWLALDEDSLRVDLRARPDGLGRVAVELFDQGQLAFSCQVLLAEGYPEPPPPLGELPGQSLPLQLDARAYNSSLFHGEGLLSLWRARSATTEGIEVDVRVPSSHHDPWLLPADTLDGAGHLAAYWFLQQSQRRFWLFPVAVERLWLFGPPPPPRTVLTCRLVLKSPGTADLDWIDASGRVAMRMQGFSFVWDKYPPHVYDWLHYPERGRRLSQECEGGRCLQLPPDYLESTGGIWRRALARRALTARERRQASWPLGAWIAAKEAAQELAARRGAALELDQIELLPDPQGRPVVHGPAVISSLEVRLAGDQVQVEPERGVVQSR